MFFLASVFICFCIASVINFFGTREKRAAITNLQGPYPFPLVGSLHKLLLLSQTNISKKSEEYFKEFGKFSRCWIFHHLLILTTDYELVKQLLNSVQHINTGYDLLKTWLGEGLLMCDGPKWQEKRSVITHAAFQNSSLEEFVGICEEPSVNLVEALREVSDGIQKFDISKYISNAVLNILIEATFGIKGINQPEYATLIENTTNHFADRYLRLSSVNNITYTLISPLQKRRQRRLIKAINKFNKEIIDQRRRISMELKKNQNPLNDSIYTIQMGTAVETISETVEHINLLDLLLGAHINHIPLTDVEISDELNTFIFQGYLLTTSALSFTLVTLSRHPTVLWKVLEEIDQTWPNKKQQKIFCLSNLNRLNYLDCVIKETLRLYPAFPIIGRELKEPFEYTHSKVGNGILPVGSEIYINIYEMLRDEEEFKESKRFRPERFLKNEVNCSNLLYFGMGERNCIAQKFAVYLMKTILVNILENYDLLPFGDEPKIEFKIGLTSGNGFQIGLGQR